MSEKKSVVRNYMYNLIYQITESITRFVVATPLIFMCENIEEPLP